MCSRFALTAPPDAVAEYFSARLSEGFPPRYNIAPTQPVHIARTSAAGDIELTLVRWGLVPGWVKNPAEFATLINARSETAAEKPSFRTAMRHKRCLFPVTAFYEWLGPKGAKRPQLFRKALDDRSATEADRLFAFAGLYETWMGADGSELDSAAILTTRANADVASIHDRMPVILTADRFGDWLDCKTVDSREAAEMLQPAPDGFLEVFEVDRRLNNPGNDDPDIQKPVRTTLL
jgi:putative SOS response-associated peptidase YedK